MHGRTQQAAEMMAIVDEAEAIRRANLLTALERWRAAPAVRAFAVALYERSNGGRRVIKLSNSEAAQRYHASVATAKRWLRLLRGWMILEGQISRGGRQGAEYVRNQYRFDGPAICATARAPLGPWPAKPAFTGAQPQVEPVHEPVQTKQVEPVQSRIEPVQTGQIEPVQTLARHTTKEKRANQPLHHSHHLPYQETMDARPRASGPQLAGELLVPLVAQRNRAALSDPRPTLEALIHQILRVCRPVGQEKPLSPWVAERAARLVVFGEMRSEDLDEILGDIMQARRANKLRSAGGLFHFRIKQLAARKGLQWESAACRATK